jgi:Spy/CpxP family protein refolding chaperone
MYLQRRYAWVLALFLGLPLMATGARAAQQQSGAEDTKKDDAQKEDTRKDEEERPGPVTPEVRLARMTKELGLTDSQQAKIKPILTSSEAKMNDLRNDSSNNRAAIRTKVMKIMQDTNKQISAQLDDKQKEKFEKLEDDRRARMQHRRRGGPVPSGDTSGAPPAPQP